VGPEGVGEAGVGVGDHGLVGGVKPGILRLETVTALFKLPTMIIPDVSVSTCANVCAGLPNGVSQADIFAQDTVLVTFTPAGSLVAH
jgi:hypothetical protein